MDLQIASLVLFDSPHVAGLRLLLDVQQCPRTDVQTSAILQVFWPANATTQGAAAKSPSQS